MSTADKLALRDRLKEKVRYRPVELREAQRISDGDGNLVIVVGGRRSGKTLAASERIADLLVAGVGLIAVVGPVFGQVRDVAIEQPKSGVLDALARRGIRVRREGRGEWEWNRSIGELRHRGEAVLRVDSLEDGARRVQGHALAACWIDELRLASDRDAELALSQSIWPALSGSPGQMIITTTPAPTKMIRRLLRDPRANVRRMPLFDNADHLPPDYVAAMRDRYGGTRLGRQELLGELIEESERALVKREWIDSNRVEAAPAALVKTRAIGLDPGGDGNQALCMVSSAMDGFLYVERSETPSGSAADFLRHAVTLAAGSDAFLVVEKNHGGTYLVELLGQVMREMGVIVGVREVWASAGKRARAEAPALLIEQGKVKFVGEHAGLEDDLATWEPEASESPHLLDAFVWATNAVSSSSTIGHESDLMAVPWDSAGLSPYGPPLPFPVGTPGDLGAVPFN